MVTMPRGEKVQNIYIITLHDDVDYNAHIKDLERVISIENARVASGDSETTLVSYVDFEIFVEAGLPRYTGTFSKPVLRWIRARQEVKRVEHDVNGFA
jgi:hypothetical protein